MINLQDLYIVGFTGSRNWYDKKPVIRELKRLKIEHGLKLLVVHGNYRGLDSETSISCDELGIDQVQCPANWKGRKFKGKDNAGPYRDRFMIDIFNPNEVLAFHKNINESKGTKYTIAYANDRGIKTTLFRE